MFTVGTLAHRTAAIYFQSFFKTILLVHASKSIAKTELAPTVQLFSRAQTGIQLADTEI